jgi:two-component system sensor histidine kinase ChvG
VNIRTNAPSTPSMGENIRATTAAPVEPNPHGASLFSRTHFSPLTRRIVFFNAFALLILIAGVLWVQSTGGGLVEERMAGIRDQAAIVGGALAEYSADSARRSIDLRTAEPLLRQLIAPTRLRAQIFATDGDLLADTRFLLARNIVTRDELPLPDSTNPFVAFFQNAQTAIQQFYSRFLNFRPFTQLEPYFEAGQDGRIYHEVMSALEDEEASAVRVNELGKLVLSVAVPIERLATHYGVLMLTTESGDIDDILAEERAAIIRVSFIAFGALLLSSLYLAGFIAAPIRRLAAAADHVRRGRAGREAIPTFKDRADEIGELAESLDAMTKALYSRIDSTERFAADVAHELKNPLTSLKSAVEMLERARDNESRDRMVELVQNDVKRIDRLITDISDASRLDAELSRAHVDPVNLSRMLETTVEIYNGMELPRGVRVDFHCAPGTNAIVHGIDERIGQVFRNLIDNAISFSPDDGVVDVSLKIIGPIVRATVEDQGCGIPTADVERIFDRFFSSRPAETEFGKNSGLGLAIARQIMSSHGGRIWADNRRDEQGKGYGARFIVELPLSRPSS